MSDATATVIDASVLVTLLIDRGPDHVAVRERIRGVRLMAPELIDLEVTSAVRGLAASGQLDDEVAVEVLAGLASFPMRRSVHRPLLPRCWELRNNLTVYDAAYVALAEAADAVLLTADRGLARAPGIHCRVEVMTSAR